MILCHNDIIYQRDENIVVCCRSIGVVVHGFQLLLMRCQELQRHVDASRQHGICANRQNGVCVQIILDEKVYS